MKNAFERAERLESKIPQEEISKLHGLSSDKTWHLINNLASEAKNYLEIGTYLGSTLKAALYGNDHLKAYAMDNFCMKPHLKGHFFGNTKDLNFTFYEEDCFQFDLKKLPTIDLYFYDGEHSFESQYKALTYYYPVLADEFIYICDDWTNKPVKEGTMKAIQDLELNIVECEIRGDGKLKQAHEWWCGVAVFKLKKL